MGVRAERDLWRRAAIASVAAGLVLAVTGVALQQASATEHIPGFDYENDEYPRGYDGKVQVCHATSSNGNPYVVITPDDSAANGSGGNGDHFSEHNDPRVWDPTLKALKLSWGDIIPPLAGFHDGLNWTDAGAAIWHNDCRIPDQEGEGPNPVAVAFECQSEGSAGITVFLDNDGDESADFTVTQDGDEVDGSPFTVDPDDTEEVSLPQSEDDPTTIVVTSGGEYEETFEFGSNCARSSGGCTQNCGSIPPVPPEPADLSSSIECSDGGLLVTVSNAGETDGTVDVVSGDDIVADDMLVPAGSSAPQLVAVAEGADYNIQVGSIETYLGTRDCDEVEAEVVSPPPTVGGVIVTKPAPQALPRTGAAADALLQIGLGLIFMGAGAVLFGKDRTVLI